ncbi:bifunctional folylpolyglutamate synthase/dihydrofolate synthase [candidate division CSSED10-310 bacterium]|uniref:tetrahydrofolate synthase n=1 Tax=candidate division CSSED10-310 bacterium TaxID=2855610 RepID=A0ABV6Z0W7_UNCC1
MGAQTETIEQPSSSTGNESKTSFVMLSPADKVKRYYQANFYLNEGLIRTGKINPTKVKRSAWMPAFLEAFGNPQRGIPAIHIAGTSGKGTTGIMIAEILRAAGVRTGLHISPYLQVATEKIWVDGFYYDPLDYYELIEDLKPTIERFRRHDIPLHGMSSVVLAIEAFRREKVEFMIFETGVGGRFDITNFLDTTLAVITKIGFDHQKTLGHTIGEIAFHKAGIMKEKTPCIAFAGPGIRQIVKEAGLRKAPLKLVKEDKTFRSLRIQADGSVFHFRGDNWALDNVHTPARGPYQVENAALALCVAEHMSRQGLHIDETAVRLGLARGTLPGRIEVLSRSPLIIIDGAHNSDKIDNLVQYLSQLKVKNKLVLCGVLAKKIKRKLITRLIRLSSHIITTEPRVYAKEPFPADKLARLFRQRGVRLVRAIPEPLAALEYAISLLKDDDVLIITGSLYLAGNIRNHWYPEADVLLQRTSYPRIRTELTPEEQSLS